jgi:hypothetical protein
MSFTPRAFSLLPLLLLLLSSLAACTTLQSVSVTQVPIDRSRPLRAEVTNTALLGIHFDNDFLDDLMPQLLRQCPRGRITGLLTKEESSLYVIVATRRVIATGFCVYDTPAAAPVAVVVPAETRDDVEPPEPR